MNVVYFPSPADFRRWLTANHKKVVEEETQKRRMATLIADSEQEQLVKPLRRPTVPKRVKK
jgi:hypothetical protein